MEAWASSMMRSRPADALTCSRRNRLTLEANVGLPIEIVPQISLPEMIYEQQRVIRGYQGECADRCAHPASHVLLAPGHAGRGDAGGAGAGGPSGSNDDAAVCAPQSGCVNRHRSVAGVESCWIRGVEKYWRRLKTTVRRTAGRRVAGPEVRPSRSSKHAKEACTCAIK